MIYLEEAIDYIDYILEKGDGHSKKLRQRHKRKKDNRMKNNLDRLNYDPKTNTIEHDGIKDRINILQNTKTHPMQRLHDNKFTYYPMTVVNDIDLKEVNKELDKQLRGKPGVYVSRKALRNVKNMDKLLQHELGHTYQHKQMRSISPEGFQQDPKYVKRLDPFKTFQARHNLNEFNKNERRQIVETKRLLRNAKTDSDKRKYTRILNRVLKNTDVAKNDSKLQENLKFKTDLFNAYYRGKKYKNLDKEHDKLPTELDADTRAVKNKNDAKRFSKVLTRTANIAINNNYDTASKQYDGAKKFFNKSKNESDPLFADLYSSLGEGLLQAHKLSMDRIDRMKQSTPERIKYQQDRFK